MEILIDGHTLVIDKEDYQFYKKSPWFVQKVTTGYNTYLYVRNSDGFLHRQLCGLEPGDKRIVDHKNKNTLDCRRSNLRVGTYSQNQANQPSRPKYKGKSTSSTYKGVTKRKGDKYVAQIIKDRVYEYLGTYDNEIDAAAAYNKRAVELYGEFAALNEI